jgi:hypothetical protein
MHRLSSSPALTLALAASLLLITTVHAVKVKTDFDKAFDFTKPQTWGWDDKGAGKVIMAKTAADDPEELKGRAEPVIKEAVAAELAKRKLQPAGTGAADLEVTYYLLVTIGMNAQYIGQFLPSVAEWGLPPFNAATQSVRVLEQGSLVLDIMADNKVVWRGVAQAEIKSGLTVEKRRKLITDAVRDLLAKYPPKK